MYADPMKTRQNPASTCWATPRSSPGAARIRIALDVALVGHDRQPGAVVFSVADTGGGDDGRIRWQKIFEPFTQSRRGRPAEVRRGPAIGLTLASRFCRLMGAGRIDGRQSARDRIALSRSPSTQRRRKPSTKPWPSAPPSALVSQENLVSTLLLVEDNEASRACAGTAARAPRLFTCWLAVDGHEAVSIGRTAKPDLILMDLGPPGHRRLGRDGASQDGSGDAPHSDHRAHRARA
jgi:CheY-like chemotaxis protein